MNPKFLIAFILTGIVILSGCIEEKEPDGEINKLITEKIIVHHANGDTKTLNPRTIEFEKILEVSMKTVKLINGQLELGVNQSKLKKAKNEGEYVEIIFSAPVNISVKYKYVKNIEVEGALIMLSGEYNNLIFTGNKRGYVNDKLGFIEDRNADIFYSGVWDSEANMNVLRNLTASI